ncbi:MAG: ABC transporter permease [Tissierellaceae bacterium]|nr:ABC transporter permease [Tissierellaceae bacterium]
MTNTRTKSLMIIVITVCILLLITIVGSMIKEDALKADFSIKNQSPSLSHFFGTDWMGRDMFLRTIKGLSMSLTIGIVASVFSAFIAVIVGVLAATMPKWVDNIIIWFIDLVMGIPHILLLLIISFVVGRGFKGLMIGIVVTHWTGLARLIRSEVLQIRSEFYIKLSKKLGKSNFYIFRKHILPHILPQFLVSLILLFPHAILHEASITFLGFGLSPEKPAIGIILSESMKYLSAGMWWLGFFPGLCLVIMIILFEKLGESLRKVMDPYSAQL